MDGISHFRTGQRAKSALLVLVPKPSGAKCIPTLIQLPSEPEPIHKWLSLLFLILVASPWLKQLALWLIDWLQH